MAPKVKERIISSIIVVITGVVVSIISVGYANSQLDIKEQERQINDIRNNKLGKKEYLEDQKDREGKHQKQHDLEFTIIEKTSRQVDWLYKNEIEKNR